MSDDGNSGKRQRIVADAENTVRLAKERAKTAIETARNARAMAAAARQNRAIRIERERASSGSVAGNNNIVVGRRNGIFAGGSTHVGRYELEPGIRYSSLRSDNGDCYLDGKKCGLKSINGRLYWSLDVPPTTATTAPQQRTFSSGDNVINIGNDVSSSDSSDSSSSSSSSSDSGPSEGRFQTRRRRAQRHRSGDDMQRAIAESMEHAVIRAIADTPAKAVSLVGNAEKTDNEREACVVCTEHKKDVVFLPCGHVCACIVCARTIMASAATKKCPNCRANIDEAKKVYF